MENNKFVIAKLIVAIFFSFALFSCNTEESEWNKIKQSDDSVEVTTFIKKYPEGKYINEAKTMLNLINLPYKVEYVLDSLKMEGTSAVSSGDYNANEIIPMGEMKVSGIIKSMKINGIDIPLKESKFLKGIIKTKDFGDFILICSLESIIGKIPHITQAKQIQINKLKNQLKL